jgi:putative component of membrane protein insertase Oxa1/YidC/SpoIIIJ protein YidD
MRCNPWSHGGVDYAVEPENTFKNIEKTSVGVN